MIMRKILLLLMLIMVVIVVSSCGNVEPPAEYHTEHPALPQVGHAMPPTPLDLVPFIGVNVDMPMQYSEITSNGITLTLENIHGFDIYYGYIDWHLYKYGNGGRYGNHSESDVALTNSSQNDELWVRLETGFKFWPDMEIMHERHQAGIWTAFFEYGTQMSLRIYWFEDSDEELLPGLYRLNILSQAFPDTMRSDHINPRLIQRDMWQVVFVLESPSPVYENQYNLPEPHGSYGYGEMYFPELCPCGRGLGLQTQTEYIGACSSSAQICVAGVIRCLA